ncbi:hypothetical protein HDF16_006384 [Granulicella aggregans]|uniref:Uncharacterized protein n=1 Tax=Granulicella aggregans TaxID=474949 RepID=A0A7W7ZKY6_9BACT|nr:hypothetical protein [Granulicella aggregans]MBB5061648.1 hypothetical protein [Granulicella aggregans]
MEYPLSISTLNEAPQGGKRRNPLTCVMAEADLGPYTDFGLPEFFFGRLVEVTGDEIERFRQPPGVEVLFRGGAYAFEALESTGSFKPVRRS